MVERGEDLRFALEAREPLGIRAKPSGSDLERDVAIELRVARAIDLAHAACAKRGQNLVRAESIAGARAIAVFLAPSPRLIIEPRTTRSTDRFMREVLALCVVGLTGCGWKRASAGGLGAEGPFLRYHRRMSTQPTVQLLASLALTAIGVAAFAQGQPPQSTAAAPRPRRRSSRRR